MAMGHKAKLISPQFVHPFVKSNKNDFVDAGAICEAATRPTMRFVTPKTEAQQMLSVMHRLRESLVHCWLPRWGMVNTVGLVPRQHSTGGKANLLGISKRGDKNLRRLLVQCARVYMLRLKHQHGVLANWVRSMLCRRHSNVVACALANKLARIAWAIAAHHTQFEAESDALAV
jgi:transposase